MKKIISLSLVVLMALSLFAVAENVPSPTLEVVIEAAVENPDAEGVEDLVVETSTDEADIEAAKEALEELLSAESAEAYFGDAAEEAKAILGSDELNVVEFVPLTVSGYKEEFGSVKLQLTTTTVFEEGQKVAVLLGIEDEWTVFEGTGLANGGLEVTLDADTLLAIQDNSALLALAI